jgi:hypothetical protein
LHRCLDPVVASILRLDRLNHRHLDGGSGSGKLESGGGLMMRSLIWIARRLGWVGYKPSLLPGLFWSLRRKRLSTVSNAREDKLDGNRRPVNSCCHWSASKVLHRELVVYEGQITVRYVSAPR